MTLYSASYKDSPSQHQREHQGGDDGGVGFDDEFGGFGAQFVPGDFLVRDGAGVGAVARGGIGDLAEVGPHGGLHPFQIEVEHRDDADREVARDAAADLKKAKRGVLRRLRVIVGEFDHVFNAASHRVDVFDFATNDVRGIHIPQRRIFPARNENRQLLLFGRQHPRVLRVYLIQVGKARLVEQFVEELVRKQALTRCVGGVPKVYHAAFDALHRLVFGDAGVGDAIQIARAQIEFVLRRQFAVVRHSHIEIVRDEVEDVFFEVGAGAGDGMHLVGANHLGERQPQFCRRHRARERNHHLPAAFQVRAVSIGGINKRGRVEVPVVVLEKIGNGRVSGLFLHGKGWKKVSASQAGAISRPSVALSRATTRRYIVREWRRGVKYYLIANLMVCPKWLLSNSDNRQNAGFYPERHPIQFVVFYLSHNQGQRPCLSASRSTKLSFFRSTNL